MILAGGLASRMGGGDKTLLSLGGRPVLAHVIERLRPQVGALALNANGDPARFAAFGLLVVADPQKGNPGPLAGVLAGLDWAAGQGAEALVTVAGDSPFLPRDLVERFLAARYEAGCPPVLAGSPDPAGGLRRHPTFGLWPVGLREDLRAALERGTRRMQGWADRHAAATAVFEAGQIDPFFNVNTPADLARAETLLRDGSD